MSTTRWCWWCGRAFHAPSTAPQKHHCCGNHARRSYRAFVKLRGPVSVYAPRRAA